MNPEVLDVHSPSQARVEKQVPAGMVIVIVDVDAILFPFPIAAAVQVVGSNYPIGIVVENDAARPVIDSPRDKNFFDVPVAPVGIGMSGPDTIAIGVPIAVMRIVRIVPTLMFPIVVTIVTVFVFFLAFLLPLVAMVVAALWGYRDRKCPC